MTKRTFSFALALSLLAMGSGFSLSQSNSQRDMRAQAQAEAADDRRDRIQEELRTATNDLAALSQILVEEVAKADGYTVSLEILESSDRIEELAQQIEELARTINRSAQGR